MTTYEIVNQREVDRDPQLDKDLKSLRLQFQHGEISFEDYNAQFKSHIRASFVRMSEKFDTLL